MNVCIVNRDLVTLAAPIAPAHHQLIFCTLGVSENKIERKKVKKKETLRLEVGQWASESEDGDRFQL